jgi:Putative phage serine protease XkdF
MEAEDTTTSGSTINAPSEVEMTDGFNFFLPISKVDEDKRTIAGYASTEAKDSDGEIVSLDAIKAALPDYMAWGNIREMHRLSAIGTAEEAHVDKKGLWLTAKISDDGAWQKVIDKVYKGFSIGGRKLNKVADKITEMAMTEISIVDRPSNPECKFALAKMDKTGAIELEPGVELKHAKRTKAEKLAKSFAKVSEFLVKAADGKPPFEEPVAGNQPLDDANKNTCEKHAVVGCEKCAAKAAKAARKLAKRKFNAEQRQSAAADGDALPDGSFPIKNQSDLDNAVGLSGNASDPAKAKAHIRAMATKHGLSLPKSWDEDDKKSSKKAAKAAETFVKTISGSLSTEPSFLNLKPVEEDAGRARHDVQPAWLELGKPRKDGEGQTLAKRMSSTASLAYCFDSIRDAARSLMLEGKAEGGDMKDKVLAKQLGPAAQILATVIGQKATHEGQEALDFSDVDDRFIRDLLGEDFEMTVSNDGLSKTALGDPIGAALLDMVKRAAAPSRTMRMEAMGKNLKKAARARKAARGAIEDCHKMLKAAYIAKMEKAASGKKKPDDDDDEFDTAGAMDKLAAAYAELGKVSTFTKAAQAQLKKMAGRSGETEQEPTTGNAHYEVPAGVKRLSPAEMATASPGGTGGGSEPPIQALDKEWAGKLAKVAGKDGRVDPGTVVLMVENARLEAQNDLLSRSMRGAASRQPYSFDLTKIAGQGKQGGPKGDPIMKAIQDSGVSLSQLENDEAARGRVIGTYMMDSTNGKSVLDPAFRGTAGLRR